MAFDPKKLGEEADEMIAKLNQGESVDAEEQPIQDVAEEQEAEQEEAITEVTDEVAEDQGEETPTSVEEVQGKDYSEELELLKKQAEAAEQRWKVLQGMINKKDEEIEAMRQLFAEMSSEREAPKQEATTEVKELITTKDREEFGNELVDFVSRASTQAVSKSIAELMNGINKRIDTIENSIKGVEKTTASTTENLFFSELGKLAPNYQQLNTDPSFLQWLEVVDPFTGVSKLQLLHDAQQKSDVRRAAAFFNAYTEETTPKEVVQEEPASNPKAKLVAPGKTKPATPRQEGKRVWTRAEIAKVYDDKMAGKISAKKFNELERDIFAAQSEGRIAA